MKRTNITTNSKFEIAIGYSRAVVKGDWVFVSGTTGYNYETMHIEEDVVLQAEQCFKNIIHALNKAEASLEDVVRVTYMLPNADDFEKCWPITKKYLGEIKPAATMVAVGLADPNMKIEIEVTALKS